MLLTQTVAASPPKSEQARPEPFMAETAAKYERSFLDVLTRQIDMSKDRTYLAAETKDLAPGKLSGFPLNQYKLDTAFGIETVKSGSVLLENDAGSTAGDAKSFKPAETGKTAGNQGAQKTEDSSKTGENQNIRSKDGKKEKREEERTAEDVEKYLRGIFAAKLDVRVSVKKAGQGAGELEISVKGLKDGQNAAGVREFLTRVEAMLKKQFPQARLSHFNIEMVKISTAPAVNGAAVQKTSGEGGALNGAGLVASKMAMTKALDKDGKADGGNSGDAGGRSSDRENSNSFGIAADTGTRAAPALKDNAAQQAQKFDQAKMIEQIRNHLNESKFSSSNGTYSIKMILRPEELGRINIEMVMKDGQLSARFKAENPATVEMLNASVEQLKEMLSERGVKVVNVEFAGYGGGGGGQRGENGDGRDGRESGSNGGSWSDGGSEREIAASIGGETFEFAETGGGKNTSVFILNDKKVNVRI